MGVLLDAVTPIEAWIVSRCQFLIVFVDIHVSYDWNLVDLRGRLTGQQLGHLVW